MTSAPTALTSDAEPAVQSRSLGLRIKVAREAKGLSQDALASAIEFADRQTLSAIENGERKVKPPELVKISRVLGHSIDYFIDPFVIAGEGAFSWRVDDRVSATRLDDFEVQVGQWIGMLRFLRRRKSGSVQPFAQTLRLTMQSTFEEALATGESVASSLKLGSVPAERLVEQIEAELDIPVLFVEVVPSPDGEGDISGATCHLPDMGVILINRNESLVRRNFDAAHELFHAMTWNAMKPDHRESNSPVARGKKKRIEQLADNFASGLLMPTSSLDKLIDARAIADVSHLTDVASQLQVSPKALAWRLLNSKRITAHTCERLCEETARVVNVPKPKRFSSSFVELVHMGIDRGYVSARKVTRTLGLTLPDLASLFEEHSKPSPFAL